MESRRKYPDIAKWMNAYLSQPCQPVEKRAFLDVLTEHGPLSSISIMIYLERKFGLDTVDYDARRVFVERVGSHLAAEGKIDFWHRDQRWYVLDKDNL